VGRPVTLSRLNGTTTLKTKFSDKVIAEYPFEGGNIDSPVIIYDDPPEDNGMDGTCSYASRPDRIETFNQTCELIIEGYGSECLQENADISFQQHLRAKHKDQYLLANGEDFARAMINSTAKQNNKIGLNASAKNKDYILKVVISYCNEDIVVGQDAEGNDIVKKGVTRIPDIALLQEIIMFNYSGNFDRITSFGHALCWARYLDSLGVMPKVKRNTNTNAYKKQQRKTRIKHRSPYSNLRTNPYKL